MERPSQPIQIPMPAEPQILLIRSLETLEFKAEYPLAQQNLVKHEADYINFAGLAFGNPGRSLQESLGRNMLRGSNEQGSIPLGFWENRNENLPFGSQFDG